MCVYVVTTALDSVCKTEWTDDSVMTYAGDFYKLKALALLFMFNNLTH